MGSYSAAQTLSTHKDTDDVITAAQNVLTAMGMTPTVDGSKVLATTGSTFLTFLLGLFAPPKVVPVHVVIDAGGDHTVELTVTDTYPINARFWLEGKIQRRVDSLAYELRLALQRLG